jgi:hypothetical protein
MVIPAKAGISVCADASLSVFRRYGFSPGWTEALRQGEKRSCFVTPSFEQRIAAAAHLAVFM